MRVPVKVSSTLMASAATAARAARVAAATSRGRLSASMHVLAEHARPREVIDDGRRGVGDEDREGDAVREGAERADGKGEATRQRAIEQPAARRRGGGNRIGSYEEGTEHGPAREEMKKGPGVERRII